MRIAWKFALALLVPLVALIGLFGYLYQRQSEALLREELTREGRAIARVVQLAAEDYLRDRQVRDLRQLVDRISGYERVLGVRLFDAKGALTYETAALQPFPFENWPELRRALAERRAVEFQRRFDRQPATGFIVPLHDRRGNLVGAAQVLQLESYIEHDAETMRTFMLTLTLAVAVATVLVVLLATRFIIVRPVGELVRSFRAVDERGIPERVPVRGRDELGWLSLEFNRMCEALEKAKRSLMAEQEHRRTVEGRLQRAERLASLGRLAAGLAHEIGTPLNVISGRAESLQRSYAGQDPAERHLGIIIAQIDRIVRIVRDMMDFARPKPARRARLDLGASVTAVLELLDRKLSDAGVTLETHLDPELPEVSADADQMQQLILNLAMNGIDAMSEGGRLRVDLRRVEGTPPGGTDGAVACVRLDVTDTGTGIAPEDLDRVFDPFYTTKDAGRGTGLGLSVAHSIVEEHGGWFDVESKVGEGTRFSVLIPVALPERRKRAPSAWDDLPGRFAAGLNKAVLEKIAKKEQAKKEQERKDEQARARASKPPRPTDPSESPEDDSGARA